MDNNACRSCTICTLVGCSTVLCACALDIVHAVFLSTVFILCISTNKHDHLWKLSLSSCCCFHIHWNCIGKHFVLFVLLSFCLSLCHFIILIFNSVCARAIMFNDIKRFRANFHRTNYFARILTLRDVSNLFERNYTEHEAICEATVQ